MGTLLSCAKSSDDSFEGVRVVQLNGIVEEFEKPVRVKDLTDQHPRHFVCSSHSLQTVNTRPLPAEEKLQLGELYFLLPFSALEGDLSPINLMSLGSKLITTAKKANAVKSSSTPRGGKVTGSAISSFLRTKEPGTANGGESQPDLHRMMVNARVPLHAGNYPAERLNLVMGNGDTGDCTELQTAYREYVLSKGKAWRPRLRTIDENGFDY